MAQKQAEEDRIRLDKWLWAARFYKTRALAKAAIESGKVHHRGERCKPGNSSLRLKAITLTGMTILHAPKKKVPSRRWCLARWQTPACRNCW